MIKRGFLVLTIVLVMGAMAAKERVEIIADHFEGDEIKKYSQFIGHVHMTKGKDRLDADQVYVYFNDKKKPIRYEAIGNAEFVLHAKTGERYEGKAEKIVFYPKEQIYKLYGNVVLKEPSLDRTIRGDKVVVDRINGKAKVDSGGKKPVHFSFSVDEK